MSSVVGLGAFGCKIRISLDNSSSVSVCQSPRGAVNGL